ncbi:MAG TPA: chemotaxis protein CheX [Gemmatimonadaceae bacterium]|nr:chemotaxis protein CheX [Gemmatimonadaceae bacterium]
MTATFEDLALLLSEDREGGDADPAPLAYAVRVAFTGPRCGFVDLRASTGVLAAAARNMLAEAQPAPDLHLDALGEIANVICGNLMPELGDPRDIYRLDAPVAVPLTTAPEADAAFDLPVEEGRVEVRLVLTPAS